MPVLVTVIMAAIIDFHVQPLPGVWIGDVNELTGHVRVNFIQADFDGDGLDDLLTPSGLSLQRNGQFPDDARHALPQSFAGALADAWDTTLFLCTPRELSRVQWRDGEFRVTDTQALEIPHGFFAAPVDDQRGQIREDRIRIRRFLHDLTGDGVPELVIPVEEGLVIFQSDGTRYEPAGIWRIYPPLRPAPATPQVLWPPSRRVAALPPATMSSLLSMEGPAVTVVVRDDSYTADESVFTVSRHRFSNAALQSLPPAESEWSTAPLPAWVQPSRLNADGRIGFAGGRLQFSDATLLPEPIFEVFASTSGGDAPQRFRTQFSRPRTLFADVNQNGRLDMILEQTGMFAGGARETMSRSLTSRRVDHEVSIHYQTEDGRFRAAPDARVPLVFQLESPPYQNPPMLTRYRNGGLVDCTGDFSGDGLLDLAVHERADRIAFYINQGKSFRRETGAAITVRGPVHFSVFDINADGRADLLVHDPDGGPPTAYLSRGAQ